MGFDPDSRVSLYGAPIWVAVLVVAYFVIRARNPGDVPAASSIAQKDGRR